MKEAYFVCQNCGSIWNDYVDEWFLSSIHEHEFAFGHFVKEVPDWYSWAAEEATWD